MASLVTLSHIGKAVGEANILSFNRAVPGTGKFSSATIFIPRDNPLFSSQYIDEKGGSLVRIDHTELGEINGFIDGPKSIKINSSGATLQIQDIANLANTVVLTEQTFTGLSSGALAREMFTQAFAGPLGRALTVGSFLETPPLVPYFVFTNGTLTDNLNKLSTYVTGQGWYITSGPFTSKFNWGVVNSRLYPIPLIAGLDIFNDELEVDTSGLTRAVTAVSEDYKTYTAEAAENALRFGSVHEIIRAVGVGEEAARVAAEARLNVGRWERSIIRASLAQKREGALPSDAYGTTGNHWRDIREGDRVSILVQNAGFERTWTICRVLSRSWQSGTQLMPVELQVLRPLRIATLLDVLNIGERPIIARSERGSLIGMIGALNRRTRGSVGE